MCLFDEEEQNQFHQGGAHDQYPQFLGDHPDLFGVHCLDAFVVWRSCSDD